MKIVSSAKLHLQTTKTSTPKWKEFATLSKSNFGSTHILLLLFDAEEFSSIVRPRKGKTQLYNDT